MPVEVDSGTQAPGFIKLKSKNPGKEILLIPEMTTTEAKATNTQSSGSVKKKDSGNTYMKTETALKKTDQEKTRDVDRKRFGNIWIYLILILIAAYLVKKYVIPNL
jgi:hypothetical protein